MLKVKSNTPCKAYLLPFHKVLGSISSFVARYNICSGCWDKVHVAKLMEMMMMTDSQATDMEQQPVEPAGIQLCSVDAICSPSVPKTIRG